jgi:carboxypeptidase Taq
LELTREWNETTSAATRHWKEAREKSDFSMFLPHLERVLRLLRERAEVLGYEEHPYNAVMVDFEPGMTVTEVQGILLPLREPLVDLVAKLKDREQPDTSCLVGDFPEDRQLEFSRAILRRIGFDFNTGRIDGITGHPMTIWCGPDDTRLTTRFSRTELGDGLFASIHEGGHGIYDQNADPLFNDLFTDQGFVSMGIHESQSRTYEEILGRGLPFWQFFFPQLQAFFPSFDRVSLDAFWRAINVVMPSLIRIHADEVTYPLHILLRFELELAMLKGDLKPADLPGAWNDKMEEYLGIRPANDAEGCLQDVHWSQGYIGYFPSYALGGLMTAQLWEAACQAIPNLAERISRGNFSDFLDWLRTNVHELGYAYSLPELVQKVTGKPLDPQVWLTYILDKCVDVYKI